MARRRFAHGLVLGAVPGDGVIYSQRLTSQRTRSRLSKIVGTPGYQNMTIPNWNTMCTLLKISEEGEMTGESGRG